MAKYLDSDGLLYFWQQLKTMLAGKVDAVSGKGLSTNDYTTAEQTKLAGIASGAEVNQNAFSKVVVDSTTVEADSKTDTLTLVAGANIVLTPNASNDTITIAANVPAVEDEMFIAVNNVTAFADVAAAYDAGAYIVMKETAAGSSIAPLMYVSGSGTNRQFVFRYQNTSGTMYSYTLKSSGWSYSTSAWVPTTRTVNGKALSADITLAASDVGALPSSTVIPDSTSDLTNDSGFITSAALTPYLTSASAESTYAKKTDVAGAYIYKGSVATYANLPSSGQTAGDVYNVEANGMNYAWNGTAWDALGETFSISSITNAEIDTILAA